jgi:ParB-like nuclease domain
MKTSESAAQVPITGTQSQSQQNDKAAEQTLAQVPTRRVAISSLVIADSPRLAGESAEHIQTLVDAPGELPPVIVHRASMRVLDGVHRLRAAERRGQKEIEVRFFDGDEADAFVIAVRSNIAHGLPLSLADRKAAATRIITSHPHWSDRLIASVTGLAPVTIAERRQKLYAGPVSADIRIGRDGRSRPTNGAERRNIASKLLTDDPSQSLRTVAKIAGISPETVRDVRDRLRPHSENSIPAEQAELQRQDHLTEGKRQQNAAGHAITREDLNQVMPYLREDPTLRGAETGRILLRLLDMREVTSEKWAELCDQIPAHYKGTVAALAMECAKICQKFAKRLIEQDKRTIA